MNEIQPVRNENIFELADLREGWSFSVAEVYPRWTDVDEEEAVAANRAFRQTGKAKESQ